MNNNANINNLKNSVSELSGKFFQFISFSAPLIIPISVLLFSLYAAIINKGLLYLALIIGIICVRSLFLIKVENVPTSNCKEVPMIQGKNLTLSMYILSFTFFYLCFPMFVSGNLNIGIISFLLFYIIFNFLVTMFYKCFDNTITFRNFILGDFIGGSAFGISISCLMYYTGGYNLLFTTDTSSNKVSCSRPSKQKFKCSVYKNGEIVGRQNM